MGLSALGYQPWTKPLRGSWFSPWPIARTAALMIFRRKLFWAFYVIALLNFMVFFSGIYLLSQIDVVALAEDNKPKQAQIWFVYVNNLQNLVEQLRHRLYLAGTGETFRNFFWLQGYIVIAVLAFGGAVLIGNDYQSGSLPFYLSKPLGRRHYLLGKLGAVGLLVNLMTTFPAVALFLQCGFLQGWDYFTANWRLFWGILGYGAVLTVCLSLLVVTLASWLRKTVPLVAVWVGLLLFGRALATALVDNLLLSARWRLIDLWNDMYVIGSACLGVEAKLGATRRWISRPQPELWEAALVLGVVCLVCLITLSRRIRAVEIVK